MLDSCSYMCQSVQCLLRKSNFVKYMCTKHHYIYHVKIYFLFFHSSGPNYNKYQKENKKFLLCRVWGLVRLKDFWMNLSSKKGKVQVQLQNPFCNLLCFLSSILASVMSNVRPLEIQTTWGVFIGKFSFCWIPTTAEASKPWRYTTRTCFVSSHRAKTSRCVAFSNNVIGSFELGKIGGEFMFMALSFF